MRLLYLADIRFPMERANGIQTIETCHALARRGVDVQLVVRRSDGRSDAECLEFFDLPTHPNLTLQRVGGGRVGFLANAAWQAMKGWDAVYTRDLLVADMVLAVSARTVVYEAHTVAAVFAEERSRLYDDSEPASKAKLARLDAREKRVCKRASVVVTITKALLESLEARHGRIARPVVAPDGCRVPETQPAPTNSNKVYYTGQLYRWKGVDVLVRAMSALDDAELVIVGGLPPEPDLDRLRELSVSLSLRDRVTFRGFLPPGQLAAERERAALFVIPNLDSTTARLYTSPLKLFEAMASGRPIVASDLPSIREVLTHDENALLVKPGDVEAFAAAVGRLLEDTELSARLASRAFEDVKEYSWERRADTLRTAALELLDDDY